MSLPAGILLLHKVSYIVNRAGRLGVNEHDDYRHDESQRHETDH